MSSYQITTPDWMIQGDSPGPDEVETVRALLPDDLLEMCGFADYVGHDARHNSIRRPAQFGAPS